MRTWHLGLAIWLALAVYVVISVYRAPSPHKPVAVYQPKYCWDGGPPKHRDDEEWSDGRQHYWLYFPCAWSDEDTLDL